MAGKKKKKKGKLTRPGANASTGGTQLTLVDFDSWELPPIVGNVVEIGTLPSRIWTDTKAQLIQNYLRLFLFITKHGVYIDGFAGPQDEEKPDSWAAKLVLELSPAWMKAFFLCELNKSSYGELRSMIQKQREVRGREITSHCGDFNRWVDKVLASGTITDKTATFALLDQRCTECHWETVRKLARHKRGDTKAELFYFFPTGWIHRAISGTEDTSALDAWWGDDGWQVIPKLSQDQAAGLFLKKIQALGYRDVKSWPISSLDGGEGRTMYHMIHATDHLEAPKLMYRAYRNLVGNVPPGQQTNFIFDI